MIAKEGDARTAIFQIPVIFFQTRPDISQLQSQPKPQCSRIIVAAAEINCHCGAEKLPQRALKTLLSNLNL